MNPKYKYLNIGKSTIDLFACSEHKQDSVILKDIFSKLGYGKFLNTKLNTITRTQLAFIDCCKDQLEEQFSMGKLVSKHTLILFLCVFVYVCAKPIECLTTFDSSVSFHIQINIVDGA